MDSFRNDVISVLREKGFNQTSYPLEVFLDTVDTNKKNAEVKVFINKWLGLFLLSSIPIISALLSVLVSLDGNNHTWLPKSMAFPISLALTFFTILNSIFKPSERFQEACRICIAINSFIISFLIELGKMDPIQESTLLDLIDKKKKDFETYQIKLISMFMPIEVNIQQDTGTKGKNG